MFGISDYGAFVAAVTVFRLSPGPGNLALITSTGKGGWSAGMACCLGVMAADQVLMWLASSTLEKLFSAALAAATCVKISGQ